jgi:hypothetical protein
MSLVLFVPDACLELEIMGGVPCPLRNQVCRDNVGSYICECVDGYTFTDDEEEGCRSEAIIAIESTVRNV